MFLKENRYGEIGHANPWQWVYLCSQTKTFHDLIFRGELSWQKKSSWFLFYPFLFVIGIHIQLFHDRRDLSGLGFLTRLPRISLGIFFVSLFSFPFFLTGSLFLFRQIRHCWLAWDLGFWELFFLVHALFVFLY